ncbi:hypothetical protein [Sporosarcina sp. 6E9]|uniref:hypothetical protein n=1 Tax=Sporosarcina sp. 6E9 TaxID=2819235 RepID=UPI001B308421|nr:hypothetical protein [Sporosarcina sp. 6E9]
MDTITEALTEGLNNAATQFISLALIIGGAYIIAYLLLSFIRVPKEIKNILSSIITAIAGYFAYIEIFLTV